MASSGQINYLLLLLGRLGYSTRFMNSKFKRLGATMRERHGSVSDWLHSLDTSRASDLIDTLKAAENRRAAVAALARTAAAAVGPQLNKQPARGIREMDIKQRLKQAESLLKQATPAGFEDGYPQLMRDALEKIEGLERELETSQRREARKGTVSDPEYGRR